MITIHIFFIAIIQGITEFLPVSSSAHLIILPYFMKVVDQGVVIDISVHLGSLFALLIYFKQDTTILFRGMIQFFLTQFQKKELLFFFLRRRRCMLTPDKLSDPNLNASQHPGIKYVARSLCCDNDFGKHAGQLMHRLFIGRFPDGTVVV